MPTPTVLIILDGLGHTEQQQHNPLHACDTPTLNALWRDCPHLLLAASGGEVGLPDGQMGNSEVGHLHIGAGRKIPQDLTRITHAIEQGELAQHPVLQQALHHAKQRQRAVHIIGLLSPGGVHSHEQHMHRLAQLISDFGVKQNYTHAILDGRDTPPRSALRSLLKLQDHYARLQGGRIATIMGRYFAMDRDKRWERTQQAYDCLTLGACQFQAPDAETALQQAYERDESDEFVAPTVIADQQHPAVTIQDDDVVILMNFRADRVRQLTQALADPQFTGFSRTKRPKLAQCITLTEYDKNFALPTLFAPLAIKNTLGEVIANAGLKQLRLAETEKYAHVTYFLNGGQETPYPNEERQLVPSPKVATYDLQPDMSAPEVTTKLIDAIKSQRYDLIVCNYANPDMIGHTGNENAAKQAILTIDRCLGEVLSALRQVGGEAVITADHGNIETMYDTTHQQPHTAHTTNLVPFFYVGRPAKLIIHHGALDDVAPTVLYLMGLDIPQEMTGRCLLAL